MRSINMRSISERIVATARLAAELHAAADRFDEQNLEPRQQDLIGGTDPESPRTYSGSGHNQVSGLHTVTDDVLHACERAL